MQRAEVSRIIRNYLAVKNTVGCSQFFTMATLAKLNAIKEHIIAETNDEYSLEYRAGWVLIIDNETYRISNI